MKYGYAKETDAEIRNTFLTFVLATLKTDRCSDNMHKEVPLAAQKMANDTGENRRRDWIHCSDLESRYAS